MDGKTELVPELIWLENKLEGARWPLFKTICIGRVQGDINIPVAAVSRRHAQLHVNAGVCAIEDLDSQNGTAVNGKLLDSGEKKHLRHGDILLLAGMVELKFVDPLATPIAPRLGRLRGLWIDDASGDVWVDARLVQPALSRKQQALLHLIYFANGQVVSRDEIIATVWAYASSDGISNDAVESLVKRLKKRLREYSSKPLLEMVRDKGVRLAKE